MSAYIDDFLNKMISRKLTVFIVATILFILSEKLNAEQWVNVAVIYIGTQGAIDAIVKLRK